MKKENTYIHQRWGAELLFYIDTHVGCVEYLFGWESKYLIFFPFIFFEHLFWTKLICRVMNVIYPVGSNPIMLNESPAYSCTVILPPAWFDAVSVCLSSLCVRVFLSQPFLFLLLPSPFSHRLAATTTQHKRRIAFPFSSATHTHSSASLSLFFNSTTYTTQLPLRCAASQVSQLFLFDSIGFTVKL